jgi:flagellar M-ring protein FliF
MPFDASAAKAQAKELAKVESSKKMAGYISMAKTALIVLFILALLLLAFRSAKKRADVVFPATDRLELEEAKRALASLQQPREIEQRGEPRELVPAPRVDPSVNEAKRALVRDEIGELVERQPEEVAQLLRGWLADRRN